MSVIVCTHNPRARFLEKVLASLQAQTLARAVWELVVVDSASQLPAREMIDLAWHPAGCVVREEVPGLTRARLRGLAETSGSILVYVDDDNVLHPDYLSRALEISRERPSVGAWGGDVHLDFEVPPPDWTRPYWERLAMKEVDTEAISSDINDWSSTPVGAGLCIRRNVLLHYREQLDHSPWRRSMDRSGASLMSAGDLDIANTACELGMGKGVFPSLRLQHLIPPERCEERYLLRLTTAAEFSNHVLRWCRDPAFPAPKLSRRRLMRYMKNLIRKRGRDRRFYLARIRGERAAAKFHRFLLQSMGLEAESFIQNQQFLGNRVQGNSASGWRGRWNSGFEESEHEGFTRN